MKLFKEAIELLEAGENLVMAVILARSGSAPRVAGTRMVVREDGSFLGTIGGGILEAQVLELAKRVFKDPKTVVRHFVFSAEEAGRMGMICGGKIQVMLHHADARDRSQLELYQTIAATLATRKPAWLITAVPTCEEGEGSPEQTLYAGEGGLVAGRMDPFLLEELLRSSGRGSPGQICRNEACYFVEPLSSGGAVMIFGAGHISQQLAPLTQMVGFHTSVLDDREDFANRRRFPQIDDVLVLKSFDSVFENFQIDENTYLVIVTRGHAHDKVLLGQALNTPAGYIGMIGSRRKRDAIYEALIQEGFSARDFERVHSPIGLEIGAETPEEIAVSIVAELIRVRSEKQF